MLKVLPVMDKESQKTYCAAVRIDYDPDDLCFSAFDDDAFRGISLFRIVGRDCVVGAVRLAPGVDDALAEYLLAKAPLNFCDRRGIQSAVFADKSHAALAEKLEFVKKDGVYRLNLEGYFVSPCHRKSPGAPQ